MNLYFEETFSMLLSFRLLNWNPYLSSIFETVTVHAKCKSLWTPLLWFCSSGESPRLLTNQSCWGLQARSLYLYSELGNAVNWINWFKYPRVFEEDKDDENCNYLFLEIRASAELQESTVCSKRVNDPFPGVTIQPWSENVAVVGGHLLMLINCSSLK